MSSIRRVFRALPQYPDELLARLERELAGERARRAALKAAGAGIQLGSLSHPCFPQSMQFGWVGHIEPQTEVRGLPLPAEVLGEPSRDPWPMPTCNEGIRGGLAWLSHPGSAHSQGGK